MRGSSGVYLVTCLANGRQYVGSSCNIKRRWNEHKTLLKNGHHYNKHWQNAWSKYGAGQFQWSILEIVPPQSKPLTEREQYWIDVLKPELNTAITAFPTNLGLKRSDETNKKHSIAMRAAWARKSEDERLELRKKSSHVVPSEAREVLRQKAIEQHKYKPAYWTGKHRSEETKQKLRAAALKQFEAQRIAKEAQRVEWEKGRTEREQQRREKLSKVNTGKHHSEETREKLRRAALAQQRDPEYRRRHQEATHAAMQDPDVLKRLSEAHKGKKLSKAHRASIGKAHQGKKRSPEAVKRMSIAQRKRRSKEK